MLNKSDRLSLLASKKSKTECCITLRCARPLPCRSRSSRRSEIDIRHLQRGNDIVNSFRGADRRLRRAEALSARICLHRQNSSFQPALAVTLCRGDKRLAPSVMMSPPSCHLKSSDRPVVGVKASPVFNTRVAKHPGANQPPPANPRSPLDAGHGPMSSIRACTCPNLSTKRCERLPSKSAAKSMISSCKGSILRSGSAVIHGLTISGSEREGWRTLEPAWDWRWVGFDSQSSGQQSLTPLNGTYTFFRAVM